MVGKDKCSVNVIVVVGEYKESGTLWELQQRWQNTVTLPGSIDKSAKVKNGCNGKATHRGLHKNSSRAICSV